MERIKAELQCVTCELCMKTKVISIEDNCPHEKNGYCALFRLQAKIDEVTFNMRKRS